MKYRVLSHTADLRLEVYGATPEELFMNSAEALAHILLPSLKEKVLAGARETIKIKSFNQNTLLVDFLNEILSRSQINKAIYAVVSLKLDTKKVELEAVLSHVKVSEFEKDIKAVTYHETDIKKEGEVWKTRLVLDI